MKEVIIKAYEFSELNDKAKEKAREWYRRLAESDSEWSNYVIEEAAEQATHLGIDLKDTSRGQCRPAIYWSGFSSQGDGACLVGKWRAKDVKADKVAEGWGDFPETTEIKRIAAVFAEVAKTYKFASFITHHRGNCNHENSVAFEFDSAVDYLDPDDLTAHRLPEDREDDPDDEPRQRMEAVFPEDKLKEAARDFMRWIYKRLESAYEYENSDECMDENMHAAEYLFTEQGSRTVAL